MADTNTNTTIPTEPTVTDPTAQNEPNTEPAAEPGADGGAQQPTSMETLAVQLSEERLKYANIKTQLDKVMSEAAGYKKQLQEHLTAEEKQAQEKAEAEAAQKEHYAQIERENTVLKGERRYLAMGFSAELAHDTAEALADGNQEKIEQNFTKWQEEHDKQMRAALMKQMPQPQSGNQGDVDYNAQIQSAYEKGDKDGYVDAVMAQFSANGFFGNK